MIIIIWNAIMKAYSKCTIGDRENTKQVTSAYSGKAESAPCVNSRRHLPPDGRVFFTFCRNRSQGDLKGEVIPQNRMPNLALLYLIQRGPMKYLLLLFLTYGKIETQRRQVNFSALHVKSGLEAINLYPWKNKQSLKEINEEKSQDPSSFKILYFSAAWHRL